MQEIFKNYIRTIYDKYSLENVVLAIPGRDQVDLDASTKKTKKTGTLRYKSETWKDLTYDGDFTPFNKRRGSGEIVATMSLSEDI